MDLDATCRRLHEDMIAPLVLGGAVRTSHAIGVREALALGNRRAPDPKLASRVQAARLRSARRLAPVDSVAAENAGDWAISAALHDIFQAVNPGFSTPLRRRFAVRILEAAAAILERVTAAATSGEALSRHTWLARVFEVRRIDTFVSWWSGSQTFFGRDPPARIRAWPNLRRVELAKKSLGLMDLAPVAVDRRHLDACVTSLLSRTPLTDIATCARGQPAFAWNEWTLGMVAERSGRTLALRALSRLAVEDVDDVLGGATRDLLTKRPRALAEGVIDLLAERAISDLSVAEAATAPVRPNALFARSVGAFAAKRALASYCIGSPSQREHVYAGLNAVIARSPDVERFF